MDVSEVIRKKGMIEILAELQEGNKTFTQIMNAVRLSMSNIVARLREAEAYRLINRIATLNEGKVEVKYTLSDKGNNVLRKIMENPEIGGILKECRSVKRKANEIEKKLDEILNNIKFDLSGVAV
ncbi:MAG: winged helix-turn-helix transcriptional regulator [Candidatus Aenigmatarchaeota archaeon]